MTLKLNPEVGSIQQTLFLPLWGRAVESQKKHPRLVDAAAVNIIERVNFDFSQAAANLDEITQIAWISRSLICDRVIRNFISAYPNGSVVNIGCGLDTTFDRVDNGKLRWYDLDLPDVIAFRTQFIPEESRRVAIASSFLEQGWLDKIDAEQGLLFMAAGVFYFFEPERIQTFFLKLREKFPGCEIIFDVASEIGVRMANKKVIESSGLDERSQLVWGLKSVKEILGWDPRIKLIRKYYYFRTLRIGPRNLLMGTLSDLLGIQYLLHLKILED